MKKRVGQKRNQNNAYTYEEYLNHFFPKVSKSKVQKTDNPSDMGISLAQASLSKMKKILSRSQ